MDAVAFPNEVGTSIFVLKPENRWRLNTLSIYMPNLMCKRSLNGVSLSSPRSSQKVWQFLKCSWLTFPNANGAASVNAAGLIYLLRAGLPGSNLLQGVPCWDTPGTKTGQIALKPPGIVAVLVTRIGLPAQ